MYLIEKWLIKAKEILKTPYYTLCQFGIDLRLFFYACYRFPNYIVELIKFRRMYKGKLSLMPCLHDKYYEAGAVRNEYFWQDLIVAQMIYKSNPTKHVDIGSRVDGFVAHVASFREIEVFDIRPLNIKIPNVIFHQADIMNPESLPIVFDGYCDSLSCLHALEHFGLGRYGDPIDPFGYISALKNMVRLLKPGGIFYLSVPIGQERVEYNAHRVFDPRTIIKIAEELGLILKKLIVINPNQGPNEYPLENMSLNALANKKYNLGLFIFQKNEKLLS